MLINTMFEMALIGYAASPPPAARGLARMNRQTFSPAPRPTARRPFGQAPHRLVLVSDACCRVAGRGLAQERPPHPGRC